MVNLFTNQTPNSNILGKSELSILMDGLDDAAFLIENQRIAAVNAKATELTAYTRNELVDHLIDRVLSFGKENERLLTTRRYTKPLPKVMLITRNGQKILSYARTTPINDRWQLITIEPVDSANNRQTLPLEQVNTLTTIEKLIQALQNNNLDEAIAKTLEVGSELLNTSVLAIYVGNSQKPSANRVACFGNSDVFPTEIFSSDINHLLEPALWIRGQRAILTFLHQSVRSAGLNFLATYPIGEVGALVGVLAAAGYNDPNPVSGMLSLKIIAEILSSIINKSTLIANLQNTVKENKENLSILESVKNITRDGVTIVTPSLTVKEMNQAAEMIMGYATHEAQGLDVNELFVGTDRLIPAIQLALQGVTTPNLGDVHLHRRDGSEFPVEISTIPIQHKKTILGVFIILRDKSESEQLRVRTHQLEQRALLGEVSAVFAHEVRNLINNISTGLQLMAEDFGEDDPNHEVIKRILGDCNRLTDLMESVLIFSRSGSYAFTSLDIGYLIKKLIRQWAPRMNRLKIDHHIHIHSDNIMVNGDKRALEQVFTNLISNAIQAMQDMGGGTLAVKITRSMNGNGRSTVQVDVSDTGPGIPDDSLHRIFEPFFTTKKNGTGLGLAITKQIVTAHKGSINLTTFPGGTVFHVKFPAITDIMETLL